MNTGQLLSRALPAVLLQAICAAGCASHRPAVGDVEPYVKIRWPRSAHLAPDDTLFFVHNPEGISQLYKVPAGEDTTDAEKLTSFADGIGGFNLSEDGRHLAITAAVGGSEQSDLFLMDATTGRMEPLFENPEVVYGGALWRRDSQAFAYRANDESPSDFHVYLYDLGTRSHRKVHSGQGHHFPADFNRDGSKLVVGRYNSASYSQLFEVTLATGAVREITPAGEEWSFSPIGYAAGDEVFLVNSNYRGDLQRVHAIDLATGAITPVLPDLEGREVDDGALNEDRTVLAVVVNEDGFGTLHLRRTADYAPIPGPALEEGVVGNIRFRDDTLLYSLSNAKTPGIVYKWNLSRPGEPAVALTTADTNDIDVTKFRLPELVHYPSFDGERIPAFLYLPNNHRPGRKVPFIVYYHGGPEGQFRPGFANRFNYFLDHGYGILAPNIRGSSGYGKAWLEADNYKNRETSVKDGVWAAKYLIDEGYASEKKLAAWGGSYGGFMVMAVITEAPELFGAACNVVGIVNFKTFLEQTKSYRRHLREAEYGPLDDPEFLESISPIRKIDRIQTPLMVAHGLNDPRVPVGEAMQVAVALKKRGVDVEELYFPDEGHGFAKEENQLLYYEQLARFFDRHLR